MCIRDRFNFGRVVLEGIGEDRGSQAFVDFQNENLSCVVDGQIKATVPDLICLVDPDTFTPVPTDALKYGKRVLAVGLECFHLDVYKRQDIRLLNNLTDRLLQIKNAGKEG